MASGIAKTLPQKRSQILPRIASVASRLWEMSA